MDTPPAPQESQTEWQHLGTVMGEHDLKTKGDCFDIDEKTGSASSGHLANTAPTPPHSPHQERDGATMNFLSDMFSASAVTSRAGSARHAHSKGFKSSPLMMMRREESQEERRRKALEEQQKVYSEFQARKPFLR